MAATSSHAAPSASVEKCVPCGGKEDGDLTLVLDGAVIDAEMRERPLWTLSEDRRKMTRAFVARNFVAALDFIAIVGEVAEAQGHHPDLHIENYREVRLELFTHKLGGLTVNDFVLAREIDAIPVAYSPKWAREHAAAVAQTGSTLPASSAAAAASAARAASSRSAAAALALAATALPSPPPPPEEEPPVSGG